MLQWTTTFNSEHEENERTSYADIDAPEESTGSGWRLSLRYSSIYKVTSKL